MPVKQPKPVTIDGVTYESYSQADRALGLPKGATSKRIARELGPGRSPARSRRAGYRGGGRPRAR